MCIFIFMIALLCKNGAEAHEKTFPSADQRYSVLTGMLPKRIDLVAGGKFKLGGRDETYSTNFGMRLLFRAVEMKAAYTIPDTRFDSLPKYQNPVFGLRLSLSEALGIPLEIKGGNLTLGGSFQKLKDPRLSENAYALGQPSYSSAGLGIFLPSFYAVQKPYALGAELRVKGKNVFKDFGAALFYGENDVFAASTRIGIRIGSKNSTGCSFTAARTRKKRRAVIRFGDDMFASSDRKWNLCVHPVFQSPFYRAAASVCIFEGLKGGWMPTFAVENAVKIGFFTLNAGAFYSPHKDVITASLAKSRTIAQFKVNPQTAFYFPEASIRIKTGALFLLEERRKTTRKKILTAKAGIGTGLDFGVNSVRLHFKAENLILSTSFSSLWNRGITVPNEKIFESASYTVGALFFQKSELNPLCAVSCAYSPKRGTIPERTQYKASASIRIPNAKAYAPAVQLSAGGSVKMRGSAHSASSVQVRAALTWKTSSMTVSGSAELLCQVR